jgi:xanthosine utilization system XapX-like protein
MQDIRIGAGLRQAKNLLTEDKGAVALYLALGVVAPFLLHAGEAPLTLRALVAVAASDGWFGGSFTGPLYLLAIMVMLWMAGQFALWNALLPEVRDGPIGEILYGFVAALAYLILYGLLTLVAGLAIGIPWSFITAPLTREITGPGVTIVGFLTIFLQLGISAFIAARFVLAGPIMAASGSMNPIPALVQSWRRTASATWRLFAMFFLIQLVSAVIFGVMLAGHTAIIFNDPIAQGNGELLMAGGWLIFWIVIFLIQTLIAAGLYRASEAAATSELFA